MEVRGEGSQGERPKGGQGERPGRAAYGRGQGEGPTAEAFSLLGIDSARPKIRKLEDGVLECPTG